jgi:microcystin-dependent protein
MTTASICPRAHGQGALGRPQRQWGALWACALNGKDLAQYAPLTTQDAGTAPGNVVRLDAGGRVPALVGGVPAGTALAFAGSTPPEGYLECDGAALSRTAYAALYAAIGTAFGAGDGSTSFNLPDLRGEFVRGWDHGRGVDAGRALGSAQADALQNITGSAGGLITGGDTPTSGALTLAQTVSTVLVAGNVGRQKTLALDASSVARTADETRPRSVALMFIIKH